jgi:hypothetical protein
MRERERERVILSLRARGVDRKKKDKKNIIILNSKTGYKK